MAIPIDDIFLAKAAIIERALRRMKQEYLANPELDNYTHIDAMTLNVERACQAAIDLAMHIVARALETLPSTSISKWTCLFYGTSPKAAGSLWWITARPWESK